MFKLSRSAQTLLIRLFFVVFAVGALYSVYDNYMFLLKFPFGLLAVIDIAFATVFFYLAYNFKKLPKKIAKLPLQTTLAYWEYVVLFTVGGVVLHAYYIGIGNAAQSLGYGVPAYIAWQAVYSVLLPSAVFGFITLLIKKKSR